MYKIEKKDFGFKLTFSGFINLAEMQKWASEFGPAIQSFGGKFGVYVDMRELKPLPRDSQEFMTNGQQGARQAGMEKSAVILENSLVQMQFKRLAKESGIYEWERYFDASKDTNFEQKALDWITKGVDPD